MKYTFLSILIIMALGCQSQDRINTPDSPLILDGRVGIIMGVRDTLRNIQTVSYMDHGRQKMISFHEPIFLTTKPYYCKEHDRTETLYYWPSGVQVKVIGYKQNNEWIIADAWSDHINK